MRTLIKIGNWVSWAIVGLTMIALLWNPMALVETPGGKIILTLAVIKASVRGLMGLGGKQRLTWTISSIAFLFSLVTALVTGQSVFYGAAAGGLFTLILFTLATE